jgi:hypothetical protein
MSNEFDLELFKKELKELMLKHNVSLDCSIEGDTYGINTNFMVCSYEYRGEKIWPKGTYHMLAEYQSYLSISDL